MSQPSDAQQMQRANELRARNDLTSGEVAELNELLARADAHEAERLGHHTRALQAQNEARETENRQLVGLLERRQKLAYQLAESLQIARDEQRAIEQELQRILQKPVVQRDSTLAGANRV